MKRFFKGIGHSLMQLYTWGAMNELNKVTSYEGVMDGQYTKVTAGDPTLGIYAVDNNDCKLPETLTFINENIQVNDFNLFKVEGFSMSPEGILNGDILLCKPIEWKCVTDCIADKYIVIKVDEGYYKKKKKEPQYVYKLRKSLMHISKNSDANDIINSLEKINDDILLYKNQKALKEKLAETRQYYKNSDLCLSITYREGSLRYSFHPIDLVKYVTHYRVRFDGQNWDIKDI